VRFPRLLTHCNVNWFHSWPTEAFVDVATEQLADLDIKCKTEVKSQLCSNFASVHKAAVDVSASYRQK